MFGVHIVWHFDGEVALEDECLTVRRVHRLPVNVAGVRVRSVARVWQRHVPTARRLGLMDVFELLLDDIL